MRKHGKGIVTILSFALVLLSVVLGTTDASAQSHKATVTWQVGVGGTVPTVSYNVYRATGTGNVALLSNVVPTSYVDTGVVAGASYTYSIRSVSSANVESSGASNPVTVTIPSDPIPPQPPGCVTSVPGSFKNNSFANQTGNFVVEFDATPNSQTMDAVIGISNGIATGYTSMGPIVRFTNGGIDARNGANYISLSTPFVSGTMYHFKLTIRRAARTYDVSVNGVEKATNFAFRSDSSTTTQLNNWATTGEQGTVTVCAFTLSVAPPPPATLTQTCTRSGMRITCLSDYTNMPASTTFSSTVTMGGKTDTDTLVVP